MTSTTDMAGHPDVAEISDLAEGLLPPTRTTDVRRHLGSCELCADVYASLEEIRGLLGTLPGPPRMPADVAGRIDAALAAEALLNATAPDQPSEAPAASSAGDHGTQAPHEGAHVSRETAPATERHATERPTADRPANEHPTADRPTTSRPSGHARPATTGPGRKRSARRSRRTLAAIGAACAAAAVGLGALLVSSLTGGTSGTTAQQHQSTASDTFSEARLPQQVDRLLAQQLKSDDGSRTPHSFGADSRTGTEGPRVFRSQATVPDCVRQGIGRDDAALATEDGVFEGKDTLLVVLPGASDSRRVDAYLMDATCVAHPSAGTAKVLLKKSYTRP